METLVPDLKKSGRVYTARDFVRGIKFIDKMRDKKGRPLRRNPANDVLEVLPLQQIAAEYKKGGEGQGSKLMFTSPPMSGSMAQKIVRMIGDYNDFTWRRVVPFLGMLDVANKSLTLPMKFRIGREYSPAIYIENVDMPRYANQIIEYARKRLKVSEADYVPVARRIRLWWD